MDGIYLQPKQYGGRRLTPVWPDDTAGALGSVAYSPVELVVVVMRLPPEVEPDQQQTEGKQEDEGPQQLPLRTHK